MFDFLKNLSGMQIAGISTIIISIIGAILKATKLMDKLQTFFQKIQDSAEIPGLNLGVLITTKATQKIGKIYELFIEPLLIMVFQFIPGIIFNFLNGIVKGLRSDNKELK